eukprot:15856-Heterococcus_DN1.PRE.2
MTSSVAIGPLTQTNVMADTMELPPLQSAADERPFQIADSTEEALSLHTGKLQSSGTSDNAASTEDVDVTEPHHTATQEATPTSDINTRDAYVCHHDDVTVSQKLNDGTTVLTAPKRDSKEREQAGTAGDAVPAAPEAAEQGSSSAVATTSICTSIAAAADTGNGSILNGYASEESDIEEPDDSRPASKTNHYGIFMTSDRAGIALQADVTHARAEKDTERSRKWLKMQKQWTKTVNRRQEKLKRRARKGIPDAVRGQVWQLMSGSAQLLKIHPGHYAALVSSDLHVDGPIEEDIPRTMFDHEMFCKHSRLRGHGKLRRVLLAYGRYDREVQYCQGINYIAALFLLYMPEEEAFWMLVAVMQRPGAPLRELFLPGMLKAREIRICMHIHGLLHASLRHLEKRIAAFHAQAAATAAQQAAQRAAHASNGGGSTHKWGS